MKIPSPLFFLAVACWAALGYGFGYRHGQEAEQRSLTPLIQQAIELGEEQQARAGAWELFARRAFITALELQAQCPGWEVGR